MKKMNKIISMVTVVFLLSLWSCESTKVVNPPEEGQTQIQGQENQSQTQETQSKEEQNQSAETKPSENKSAAEAQPQENNPPEQSKEPERVYTPVEAVIIQVQKYINAGKRDVAVSYLENLEDPELQKDFSIRMILCSLLISQKEYEKATVICEALKSEYPGNVDVLELSAMLNRAKGNQSESKAELTEILKKDPKNPEANKAMGDATMLSKNYGVAKVHYKRALESNENDETAMLGYARACYFMEEDEEARKYLEKLIEQNPQNDEAYYNLAKLEYVQNNFNKAVIAIEKAIELNGTNYDYWIEYGLDSRYMGNFKKADAAWSKAIQLDPEYFLAYAYRAGLYEEEERVEEAIRDYRKVLKLNPKYTYAYESLGLLYFKAEQWKECAGAFMKCREYNPSDYTYPMLITYALYKMGKPFDSKEYANQALRKMNRESVEYSMLRCLHDGAGDDPLLRKIQKLESQTKKTQMYFYLGLFYDMFASPQLANAYFEKVVAQNDQVHYEWTLANWKLKHFVEQE